ncbi:hypothetical protein OIA45_48190 (plasmid) [Streptomyces chartreusis]|jgi:hypothetical protein|uniref:hypothetical protein n=1 Tax=Streptomyces chartreusis TaxID=1969 RepID=UPI002F908A29|nr:hypothetical protein OIA45_45430 [Streptomyces chartreusis]WTA33704.1 hypothetical protein OIA45_48190 [Streptomyces chartreusis]
MLIEEDGPLWPQASFEYRATHDVLALSVLLACPNPVGQGDRRALRALVDNDVEWALWCESQLTCGALALSSPDLALAGAAWRWLANSRLLGGSFHVQACQETATRSGVGVSVGVTQARRLLNRFLGA